MLPGMNSRKAAQMMKKMGIQQKDLEATEVIIRTVDKEIIITEPSVAKINMMGQEVYQISGNEEEHELSTAPAISEDDIKTVMEQASVDEDTARKAIEDNDHDLAAAIMALTETS